MTSSISRQTPGFNREKYLAILQAEGISSALTALHRDIERIEFESFEGEQGWRPELFDELKQIRAFSREIWDEHLARLRG
jgi:hypothetical protein